VWVVFLPAPAESLAGRFRGEVGSAIFRGITTWPRVGRQSGKKCKLNNLTPGQYRKNRAAGQKGVND